MLDILNVGGCVESLSDRSRICRSITDFLHRRCVDLNSISINHIYIDLFNGIDFLTYRQSADIAILHWIWDGNVNTPNSIYWKSPFHSIENFRTALLNTKASCIYVYGGVDEISGIKLGNIVGYSRFLIGSEETVYDRIL